NFNNECPDDQGVRYFEVVGVGRKIPPPTASLFKPFRSVMAKAGPNDGVVPLTSATCNGTRHVIAEWPGDHADLIGYDLDAPAGPPTFPHLEKYEELVQKIPTL